MHYATATPWAWARRHLGRSQWFNVLKPPVTNLAGKNQKRRSKPHRWFAAAGLQQALRTLAFPSAIRKTAGRKLRSMAMGAWNVQWFTTPAQRWDRVYIP